MTTQSRSIRRGLPRVEGGDPWPAAGQVPARIVTAGAAARSASVSGVGPVIAGPAAAAPSVPAAAQETAPGAALSAPVPAVNAGAVVTRQLRRGLPRVPGGEPWPPAGQVSVSVAALSGAPAAGATPAPAADAAADAAEKAVPAVTSPAAAPATATASPTASATLTMGATSLRRGLPRVPDGEPWPPAGFAPAAAAAPAVQADSEQIAQAHAPATSVVETVAEAEPPAAASAPAVPAAVPPRSQPPQHRWHRPSPPKSP